MAVVTRGKDVALLLAKPVAERAKPHISDRTVRLHKKKNLLARDVLMMKSQKTNRSIDVAFLMFNRHLNKDI